MPDEPGGSAVAQPHMATSVSLADLRSDNTMAHKQLHRHHDNGHSDGSLDTLAEQQQPPPDARGDVEQAAQQVEGEGEGRLGDVGEESDARDFEEVDPTGRYGRVRVWPACCTCLAPCAYACLTAAHVAE
eukprot:scaffold928_cov370-Prasinococcus_capsulatus_cf.AAC.2